MIKLQSQKLKKKQQPSSLHTKKLGEVCDVLDNKRKPVTKRDRTAGEYPYYGATGILDYVKNYIFDEKLILIGEDGAKWESGEHTAFIADGKYWVNNHAHVIRPHRDIILDNWMVYFFYLTDLTKHTTGLTVPKLNQANLRNIEIPLPPLAEQKRIVKILDEVFEGVGKVRENAEKNLKNSQELFESYLQNIFANPGKDWEEKKLGEVCNIIGGGTPSKANAKFYDGDIPWATVRDMKFEIIKETEHRITIDAVKNSSTNIIPKGNVIIATRVGLGKVCLIENNTAINQDLRGVVPINPNQLLVGYLFQWLKSIAHNIIEEGTGATVQGVKLPFVKSLLIPLPPLSEQKAIVKKLDALSAETKKLEAIFRRKIADLDELKKSVLKQAFAGKL